MTRGLRTVRTKPLWPLWLRPELALHLVLFCLLMLFCAIPTNSQARDGTVQTDVELVFAVDVSYSMDPEEQYLQRQGYIEALRSPLLIEAIRKGIHGRIAATYIEWAGEQAQRIVVPWQVIDSAASAEAFIALLNAKPPQRLQRTSISGAIDFSAKQFVNNGFSSFRQVIDISGDGSNNNGRAVTQARDAALAAGIVINGLPIILNRPNERFRDVDRLDHYYEDCVIGGPASFVIAINSQEQFTQATRTKLILEISDLTPKPDTPSVPVLMKATAEKPRISCLAGERLWQERWGRDF